MEYDKPYAWLDTSGASPIVMIKLWNPNNYQIATTNGYFYKEETGDALRLIFTLHAGRNGESTVSFDLSDRSSPRYNPTHHTKITIIVINSSRTILGLHTVMPVLGSFGTTPFQEPRFVPYAWLDFITTECSVLNIAAELPDNAQVNLLAVNDFPNRYERVVKYKVGGTLNNTTTIFHLQHLLDASNGYDPIFENIIVHFIEFDAAGIEKKKGTGTVHSSEGDASGEV